MCGRGTNEVEVTPINSLNKSQAVVGLKGQTVLSYLTCFKQLCTYCLIPAPGPALSRVFRVPLNRCWLCAATSSHPTKGQLTNRTSSAQSHTRLSAPAWWLRK